MKVKVLDALVSLFGFLLGKSRQPKPSEATETEWRYKSFPDPPLTVVNPEVVREYTEDALGLKRDIRLWWGSRCVLPVSHITSVAAWVHEFSELAVHEQIEDVDGRWGTLADKTMKISFNGVTEERDITHILVALHCISSFGGKMISPEEFERILRLRQ